MRSNPSPPGSAPHWNGQIDPLALDGCSLIAARITVSSVESVQIRPRTPRDTEPVNARSLAGNEPPSQGHHADAARLGEFIAELEDVYSRYDIDLDNLDEIPDDVQVIAIVSLVYPSARRIR